MKFSDIKFLTSNPQKAKDFTDFGLGVQSFTTDIIEVLSPDVETVVLHKARDTGLNNIVVEDTALTVEGANFFGTEIKHIYESIKDDEKFHNHQTVWEVSLCMKKGSMFYIASGRTKGILKYPSLDIGYNFNKIFAIPNANNEYQHFELFSEEDKKIISPRFKALRLLTNALKTDNYSNILMINEKDIPDWSGKYQKEENIVRKHKM